MVREAVVFLEHKGYKVLTLQSKEYMILDPAGIVLQKEGSDCKFRDIMDCESHLAGVIANEVLKAKIEAGRSVPYDELKAVMREVHEAFKLY